MRDLLFIFDADHDLHRAQQVTSSLNEENTSLVGDTGFAMAVKQPPAIATRWIDERLASAQCVVVLIGEHTSNDPWVRHAIVRARQLDRALVGVVIETRTAEEASRDAEDLRAIESGVTPLWQLRPLETYDPPFSTWAFARWHIKEHLPAWVRWAIADKSQAAATRRWLSKPGRR